MSSAEVQMERNVRNELVITPEDEEEFLEYYEEEVLEDDDDFTEVTYQSEGEGGLLDGADDFDITQPVIMSAAQKEAEEEHLQMIREQETARKEQEALLRDQLERERLQAEQQRKLEEKAELERQIAEKKEVFRKAEEERVARQKAEEAAEQMRKEKDEALRLHKEAEERRLAAEAEAERLALENSQREEDEAIIQRAEIAAREAEELERLAQLKEEKRKELEELEARRLATEAEAHRVAATKAEAEKQKEEAERQEKLKQQQEAARAAALQEAEAMKAEVKRLEAQAEAARVAAEEAKRKKLEEQERFQSRVAQRHHVAKKKLAEKKGEPAPPTPKKKKGVLASIARSLSPRKRSMKKETQASAESIALPLESPEAAPALPAPLLHDTTVSKPQQIKSVPTRPAVKAVPPPVEKPMRSPLSIENPPAPKVKTPAPSLSEPEYDGPWYSADDLRRQRIPDLDYTKREIYLSPEEFQEIFAMTREEYYEMPKWKQTKLKRSKKLF